LIATLDACNRRFGRGAVVPVTAGLARKTDWSTKFEMRSPRYDTGLDELPVVAAA
jgi:DNA polymerase V